MELNGSILRRLIRELHLSQKRILRFWDQPSASCAFSNSGAQPFYSRVFGRRRTRPQCRSPAPTAAISGKRSQGTFITYGDRKLPFVLPIDDPCDRGGCRVHP